MVLKSANFFLFHSINGLNGTVLLDILSIQKFCLFFLRIFQRKSRRIFSVIHYVIFWIWLALIIQNHTAWQHGREERLLKKPLIFLTAQLSQAARRSSPVRHVLYNVISSSALHFCIKVYSSFKNYTAYHLLSHFCLIPVVINVVVLQNYSSSIIIFKFHESEGIDFLGLVVYPILGAPGNPNI